MNRLRFWRIERGLSQMELAALSAVPRYIIQVAEQGLRLPEKNHQEALASSLGVQMVDLFSVHTGRQRGKKS